MVQRSRLSTVLSGVAGEYFVAAELSRRGYIASITLRNTQGIDILASNGESTRTVGIQVKTNQGSCQEWMLNSKIENDVPSSDLFFVFVNLNVLTKPSYHIVPRKKVSQYAKKSHAEWLSTPGKSGKPHKDTSVRKFRDPDNLYLDRWDLLGLD